MLNLPLKTAMFRRIGAPVSKQAIWQVVLRAGGGAARDAGLDRTDERLHVRW